MLSFTTGEEVTSVKNEFTYQASNFRRYVCERAHWREKQPISRTRLCFIFTELHFSSYETERSFSRRGNI